ncbi:MAG: flavin reductase family protein [Lachnospiraceae bacterium]|nr:flavin reductase family protein [Lachnospiraceae bacterium]
MSKITWKPGNMLYPLPVVMVSCADKNGKDNILTIAWTGTTCSNPPMLSISVRKERYSYHMIEETGEFVVNLTTEALAYATDFCGVKSGKDIDKWKEMHLTRQKADVVKAPLIKESPVNIECKVREKRDLGSHVMYQAEVVAVHVEQDYMDENEKFHLEEAKPIVYSHGTYFSLGKELGTFGYSVRKK